MIRLGHKYEAYHIRDSDPGRCGSITESRISATSWWVDEGIWFPTDSFLPRSSFRYVELGLRSTGSWLFCHWYIFCKFHQSFTVKFRSCSVVTMQFIFAQLFVHRPSRVVCNMDISAQHALICTTGGLRKSRHSHGLSTVTLRRLRARRSVVL